MFKTFTIKTPIATKEVTIIKSVEFPYYTVDIISYGNWDVTQFKTLQECFNYIRSYFNIQKGKENE